MVALTAARQTPQRGNSLHRFTVAATFTVFEGSLVMVNSSGLARPGATATGMTCVGRAENGAAAGQAVDAKRGVFLWANSAAGDAITDADYGATVFIVDDQTVAKTSASSTRSAAGICRGVDAATGGVWVET